MENEEREKLTELYRDCWDSFVKTDSKLLVALSVEEDDVQIVSFDLLMQLMRDQWQERFSKTVAASYGSDGILEELYKRSEVKPSHLHAYNHDCYETISVLLEYPIFKYMLGSSFVNQQSDNVRKMYVSYRDRVKVLQQQEEDQGDVSHV
nr:MAG TPA: hypothetical protein [Inoviridae sp.]